MGELDDLIAWSARRKAARSTELRIPYCAHVPTPRQLAFLQLDCREALFGGAAGGGKSDSLLMAALQYVDQPDYAAILFRRTYADLALPGAIMDRSREWLQSTNAHWCGDEKTWKFPSGATLTFGYLQHEGDQYRYQSSEFQFVGFDELTQFPEKWYTYMFSRLRRRSDSTVPLRMRGATNPGGLGHKWVKNRFVEEKTRGETVFVPSKLADNPHVDAETYRENLSRLDVITRAQLEDGKWVQDSSGLVYSSWDREHLVVPAPVVDSSWRRILSFDFGNVDDTAWVVLGWPRYSRTTYVLESHTQSGLIPSDCARIARELETKWRLDRIVGDVGGLGKGYAEEMRVRYGVPIEAAEKTNKRGYIKLVNGAFSNREAFVAHGNEELCAQLEELPWGDAEHTAEAEGMPNHLTDAYLYGWRSAVAWAEPEPPAVGPAPGTDEALAAEARRAKDRAVQESLRRGQRQFAEMAKRYR